MKNIKKLLLSALALLMMVALTACSQGQGTSTDGVKRFTVALGGEPEYLDPALASDAVSTSVIQQMYYPLFSYGTDGSIVSEAVESYTISEDGLVYTFKLVAHNWSDGKAATAHDYEYGIKRIIGYGPDASYAYFITDYVKNAKQASLDMLAVADMGDVGVKAIDDLTLEITLERATPFYTALMTNGVYYPARADFAKEKEGSWANDPNVPVNGAFKLISINETSEIVLAKNEQFLHVSKMNIDELVMKVMPDMDAQLLAFQNGELDMARSVSSNVVTLYADQPELVIPLPFVVNYYVRLNSNEMLTKNEALLDVNVRRALALALNRADIITAVNGGDAYYELYGMVPRGIPGKSGDFREEQDAIKKYLEYNPEEAKRLLNEAGYNESNPLKIEYYYNPNSLHDTVASVMQQQWKAVGVDVTLKTAEIRTFFDDRSKGNYSMSRDAMSADYMDPVNFLDLFKSVSQEVAVYNDPFYDDLMNQSQAELDHDKRMDILHTAETYAIEEQVWVIPVFGYANPYLVKAGVTGIEYDPSGSTRFYFVKLPE